MEDYRSRAYSRYSADYALEATRLANSYDRRLSKYLRPEKHWSCLDIACGYGNMLAYYRSKGISDYVGIDTAEASVAVANREFGAERVHKNDAVAYLTTANGRYDLITALDFIEHVRKDELYELVDLMCNALKPNAFLLLRTPNANALFGMAARYNDITHEQCFTTNSISDVLCGCGFEVKAIWEDQGRPTTLLQLVHWLAWKSMRFVIRCANAAETGTWGDGVLTRNMWVLAEKHD